MSPQSIIELISPLLVLYSPHGPVTVKQPTDFAWIPDPIQAFNR